MELKIIAPEGTQTHTILWIELNTKAGNFVVQDGHTPMIVSLSPDKEVLFCLKNGKQERFTPTSGVAEIARDSTSLLLMQSPK